MTLIPMMTILLHFLLVMNPLLTMMQFMTFPLLLAVFVLSPLHVRKHVPQHGNVVASHIVMDP
jgi:hypothetical protein